MNMEVGAKRLAELVATGLVKGKRDPLGSPLTLYEYTPQAMGEREWDDTLASCRGLVVDDDWRIVASPFRKFFNLGERPETKLENLPAEVPMASEKLDGSLIIIFNDPHQKRWRAVTRGAWESEQAQWAQKRIDANRLLGDGIGRITTTYCCELIAPWNRVVIPYNREELVLLAAFEPGGYELKVADVDAEWIGADRAIRYEQMSIEDAKARESAKLDEGWVFRYSNGLRVKLKYAEYVRLHRIVTGFSARRMLESLAEGNDPLDTTAGLHDDFLAWYERELASLKAKHAKVVAEVNESWAKIPPTEDRKQTALAWKGGVRQALWPLMFRRLDGGDWQRQAWKLVDAPVNQKWFSGDES